MKRTIPGLILGGAVSIVSFVSQSALPSSAESPWMILSLYLILFVSFFLTGFWYKKTGGKGGGIRVGVITAVLSYTVIMAVYFMTGSRPVAIVRNLLLGLPILILLGAIFGGMGGVSAVFLEKRHDRKLPGILYVAGVFFPYAAVITVCTGLLYLTGEQILYRTPGLGTAQLAGRISILGYQLVIGWIVALVTVFFAIIIWELLNRSEAKRR